GRRPQRGGQSIMARSRPSPEQHVDRARAARNLFVRGAAGVLTAAAVLASSGVVAEQGSLGAPAADAACLSSTAAIVTAAETIDAVSFRLLDGRIVRLAAVAQPSSPKAEFDHAGRAALARLVDGQSLRLVPAAPGADRYGRLLAQI